MATERTVQGEPSGPGGAGPRAKLWIAILIALVAVGSSIASWRSDVALQDREALILRAEIQDLDRRGLANALEANLADSRITIVRMRAFERRARALESAARSGSGGADARRRLAAQAAGYRAMAATARERVLPDLFPDGDGAAPDYAAARRLGMLNAAATRDLDPVPELSRADRLDQRAADWRWVSLALLFVALLLTLAEVSRSRWYLAFLVAGVVVLVAIAGVAGGVEVLT